MNIQNQAMSDHLPERLPASLRRERVSTAAFRGMTSVGTPSGSVADMVNMSPRCAPALATRKPRGLFVSSPGSGTPHGMEVFDGKLFFVQGTTLYRAESSTAVISLGTVSDTDKQFFVFGDRLYIYPDKLYVAKDGTGLLPIELDTGVVEQVEFDGHTITLPEGLTWTALGFAAGDGLRVLNADDVTPAPEGYYRITDVRGQVATLVSAFAASYISNARFLRTVPDLKRVCVSGDRVYGIAGRDVYISAAGSALDFYSKGDTDGRGPVVLHTDTEGDFTACALWQGYVVFFKPDRISKLMGTRSDSFTLQDTRAVGLSARLTNTLCELSGALYYQSDSGVYCYRGQEPERVCSVGDAVITNGCGGTDGYAYYLAVERGNGGWRQYVWMPETGELYAEDGIHPVSMLYWQGFLCLQDSDGVIWLTSSDGRTTGCSLDERQIRGAVRSSVTLHPDYGYQPDGCRLTGIYIRATAQAGATLEVLADYADGQIPRDADGTEAVSLGVFEGKMSDRLLRIPVVPRLCDAVTLRLVMKGDWVIHAITREYEPVGR